MKLYFRDTPFLTKTLQAVITLIMILLAKANYKVLCADIGVNMAQTYADICVIEGNRKSHVTSDVTGHAHATIPDT